MRDIPTAVGSKGAALNENSAKQLRSCHVTCSPFHAVMCFNCHTTNSTRLPKEKTSAMKWTCSGDANNSSMAIRKSFNNDLGDGQSPCPCASLCQILEFLSHELKIEGTCTNLWPWLLYAHGISQAHDEGYFLLLHSTCRPFFCFNRFFDSRVGRSFYPTLSSQHLGRAPPTRCKGKDHGSGLRNGHRNSAA